MFSCEFCKISHNSVTWWYVLKTSLRYLCKTSWRCLEDILKMFLQDVLKTSWRCLGNILKMSWRRMGKTNILALTKTSWRRKAKVNILVLIKTSSRCLLKTKTKDVFIKTNVCWVRTGQIVNERRKKNYLLRC